MESNSRREFLNIFLIFSGTVRTFFDWERRQGPFSEVPEQGGPCGTPKEQGKLTAFLINYLKYHSAENRMFHWELRD